MKKFDLTFEEEEEQKEIIAKNLWGNVFFTGLQKLNKIQLMILINSLIEELDFHVNLNKDRNGDERDFKDKAWDQKCLMIESVMPNFFKRQGENE